MIRLARISTVFLLLLPLNAAPLGLGDINLQSALNQPLDARIALTAIGQTRMEEVSVRLASREAFAQAGLERPLFLSDLKFTIERDESGVPVVSIRSGQAIAEPFLDFLVEMNWPNGRLLREYTVLLDPPLLLDEAPVPVAAPAVAPAPVVAQSAPARAAAAASAAAPRPGPQVQQDTSGAWSYGPVARDATLWSIAQELRGLDTSYSVEQIMMALLRSNPEAFYNGNVNELKAGYVLRIDDPALIGAMSQAAALAEARRQTTQWMDAKREAADRAANRPQAGESAPVAAADTAGAAASSGPLLRLSAPDKADVERFAAGAIDGEFESGAVDHLRQELTEALEVSASARQENVELRQRLAALEEQIASMQRLLTLQEDTLAGLQSGAAANQADQARRDGNPLASLLNDPLMLGVAGFGALLLAILGWLVARRRRSARAALEEFTVAAPFSGGQAVAAGAASAGAGVAGAGLIVAEEDIDRAAAGSAGGDEDDVIQAEEDEIDVLAEADVYLAYRRIDKAEELLRQAIKDDPERTDLRLKLLEVYAAGGDTDAFVLQSEVLRASLGEQDASLWDKVVAMGKRLAPEHPLFAAGAVVGLAAGAAERDVVDESVDPELAGFDFEAFGRSLEHADDGDRAAHSFTAHGENDGALEFNLDEDMLARLHESADGDAGNDTGNAGADAWLSGGAPDADDAAGREETGFASAAADASVGLDDVGGETRWPGSLGDMVGMPAQAGMAAVAETAENDGDRDENELELSSDIDWLTAVGEELTAFESDELADGEDFSGLISGTDEVGTKLDLAKAYIDMGDEESARSILSEVTSEGSEDQQREASALMRQMG